MNNSNIDARNSIHRSAVLQSKLRFALRACAMMALLVAALTSAFHALFASGDLPPDLTGTYMADDGGIYYVQQSGTTLWWAGMSLDSNLTPDSQWHRGLNFTNVFRGTVNSDYTVAGEWADVNRGLTLNSGTLKWSIGYFNGRLQLTKVTGTGGFGANTLTQSDPLDDTKFDGITEDIYSRFDLVHKNNTDETLLNPNLKPYRDATVFYGRLVNSHINYLADNLGVESEIPHVNYGVNFSPPVRFIDSDGNVSFTYLNFGGLDRTFDEFLAEKDIGDCDMDVRLKVDQDKLEHDFYTTGWGNHTYGPEVFNLKLNDASTHQKLNYAGSEAYMGLETIMFGRYNASTTPLLPGWAEADGNSVLVNGRPINGFKQTQNPPPYCGDFVQPCPYLDAPDPATLLQNGLFVSAAGIALGNLLESAYGDGKVPPGDGAGTYLRVTGALILDCGHGYPSYPCFDGDNDNPDNDSEDVSTHQNQEIHPVYSIDIINYPFRPEDITVDARKNLTGAWGAARDGSTYYVRQIGNTIWWLGQMRDRQPIQRGTSSPIIGTYQLQAAFNAGDPACSSNQCWAFATVFKGTINAAGDTVEGDWAGAPQSTSAGSNGGHMKFYVYNHKILVPATSSIFPVTIEKMYNPEDTTPPQSTLTIGPPQYPVGSSQPFVTTATPFTVTATDGGSGVQNVWYRFFPSGSSNPPSYTSVTGSSATFYLSGPDGLYEVDTYATDNAGNDEAPAHSQVVYLDNTAPMATIVQPTATQYLHSDSFTISYTVSDGTGSGVKSATPNIDGLTILNDGTTPVTVANGLTVKLLTELTVGTHTFNVYSVDNINNAGTNSVTFSIVVTAQSIIADVKYFRSIGAITQDEATSFLSKLNSAAKARAKGDCANAATIYTSFISELQAQSGKKVSAQAAAIMIADAQYLIAHCP